jgi:hypothetical protein
MLPCLDEARVSRGEFSPGMELYCERLTLIEVQKGE